MTDYLEIGHMHNRSGGRERVVVILRCLHGDDDDDIREFFTTHEEYERLDIEQRADVIDEAVEKHRENLLDEHRLRCACEIPSGFGVRQPNKAMGRNP